MNGHKSNRLIKSLGFLTVLGLLLFYANAVFTPKWRTGLYHSAATITGFYTEPRRTIDVLFLGSSHIECSISPLSLWHNEGITSYSMATPLQSPLMSYYYLREVLKYQDIKLVAIEPKLLYREQNVDAHEESYRNTLDYMRLSLNKVQAAADIVSYSENQTVLGYVLPLLRYHSRWNELSAEDFELNPLPEHSLKGFVPIYTFTNADSATAELASENELASFTAFGMDYMDRIAKLCQERGIILLLVQPPETGWNPTMSVVLGQWAEKRGLPIIDYNTPENLTALDLQLEVHYFHPTHLNIYGAEVLTEHLGDYLAEHFELTDHRGDPINIRWNDEYSNYLAIQRGGKLNHTTDFQDYLAQLSENDFLVVISGQGDAASGLTTENIAGLQALGLEASLQGHASWAYLAIIDAGQVMYENTSDGPIYHRYTTTEGLQLDMLSPGNESTSQSSIVLELKEYSRKQPGLNIVVYDKKLGKVIDSVNFDTSVPDAAAKR